MAIQPMRLANLPSGIWSSDVKTDMTEAAGLILSISGDDYSYDQLASFAKQYKEELEIISGIKKIDVEGELEKDLVVEINNEKLLPYDISINDIYDLIRAQNVVIPSGSIKTDSGKINLKTPQSISSQKDIENLTFSILYTHPLQYHIVDLDHETRRTQVKEAGEKVEISMPNSAVARRAQYVLDKNDVDGTLHISNG